MGPMMTTLVLVSLALQTNLVDPDTLVVPQPEAPPVRHPAEDINRLLRAELSILEAVQDLDMDIAKRSSMCELRWSAHIRALGTSRIWTSSTRSAGTGLRSRKFAQPVNNAIKRHVVSKRAQQW